MVAVTVDKYGGVWSHTAPATYQAALGRWVPAPGARSTRVGLDAGQSIEPTQYTRPAAVAAPAPEFDPTPMATAMLPGTDAVVRRESEVRRQDISASLILTVADMVRCLDLLAEATQHAPVKSLVRTMQERMRGDAPN